MKIPNVNILWNIAKNVSNKEIRSSCLLSAKNHFEQMRHGFQYGKNIYIRPENKDLINLNIYDAQKITGGLFHGARDAQTVIDLAKNYGAFPPGKGLHVVAGCEVGLARSIAGPKGVMVLVESKEGVASDAYGNLQIPLYASKRIIGIWEKDIGRNSIESALCASICHYLGRISSSCS